MVERGGGVGRAQKDLHARTPVTPAAPHAVPCSAPHPSLQALDVYQTAAKLAEAEGGGPSKELAIKIRTLSKLHKIKATHKEVRRLALRRPLRVEPFRNGRCRFGCVPTLCLMSNPVRLLSRGGHTLLPVARTGHAG